MTQQQVESLIQLLDVEPQIEGGQDDIVYGSYVEFPPASLIDPRLIPDVLEILEVPLPFAREVTVSSLRWLQSLRSPIRTHVLSALGTPTASIQETGAFLLSFPQLAAGTAETNELVDVLLPSTVYEHDLPDSHRYWQPDPDDLNQNADDELLDLYRTRPVAVDRLIGEVKSLRVSFEATLDLTVQKAILFAVFSLIENFTRQRALLKAPQFHGQPKLEELVLKLLRNQVKDDRHRKEVVGALEPEKSWAKVIPEWELRNALAHDIGSVGIEAGKISFEDKNQKTHALTADGVFDALLEYVEDNLGDD